MHEGTLAPCIVWGSALLIGCAQLQVPIVREAEPPAGWLERLAQADKRMPGSNFPLPAPELERLMRAPEMESVSSEPAGSGVMGALRIEARFPPSDRVLKFKWKRAPDGGDNWNNTPRLEIAVYEIQKWFLSPADYVVPPTIARCVPVEEYGRIEMNIEPNIEGARCVFGALSVWLVDVEEPESAVADEARFYREPRYALSLARYNLIAYLVRNRDTRMANRLVSTLPDAPRIFAIDNGISFDTRVYNFFQRHWNQIRVPALPRDAIDRLRKRDDADFEALRVVAEFRDDGKGTFVETRHSTALAADVGVRLSGGVLQLGLVSSEIDSLRLRLRELLEAVDRGEIPLF